MTGWQITAKTIFCDAVDDEVTILVNKDGTAHCTGYSKYTRPNDVTRSLVKKKERLLKKHLQCQGEQCPRVTEYTQKTLAEDRK
jgi:hypothetical protein